MEYKFQEELNRFVSYIESIESILPVVALFFDTVAKKYKKDLQDSINGQETVIDEDGVSKVKFPSEKKMSLLKLEKRVDNLTIATKIMPRNQLVSLVSSFDAYLGRLIRTMYFVKPELLNASQKNITLSDLMSYSSLDSVKEHFIEKEIDSVLRESHSDHFDWLEKKLEIPLKKGLSIWPAFIELTERRNLFVHCDGIVSSQYLSVCGKHGYTSEKEIKVGAALECNAKYLRNATNIIMELGIKLGQVMWRKLQPNEIKQADLNLNDITYALIQNKNYDLTISLLEFAIIFFKKNISDEYKYYFLINLAQAYKWKGNEQKMRETLSIVDWSPLSYEFRLAHAVLTEQFSKAVVLMKNIGAIGEIINKDAYIEWPLFCEFRESDDFKNAYYEIFGESCEFLIESTQLQEDNAG